MHLPTLPPAADVRHVDLSIDELWVEETIDITTSPILFERPTAWNNNIDCNNSDANEHIQQTSQALVEGCGDTGAMGPSSPRNAPLAVEHGKRHSEIGMDYVRISADKLSLRDIHVPLGFPAKYNFKTIFNPLLEGRPKRAWRMFKKSLNPQKYTHDEIHSYKILKKLGEGGHGVAVLAKRRYPRISLNGDEKLVVLKACPLARETFSPLECQRVYFEAKSLQELQHHPNIVPLYKCFVEKNHMILELEYLPGGDLYQAIYEDSPDLLFPTGIIISIAQQLFYAARHMHNIGISHRDIKAENIMCDVPVSKWDKIGPTVKLIDFGVAHDARHNIKTSSIVGTPAHTPPELLFDHYYAPPMIDIYQIGLVMYQMLTGNHPFQCNSWDELAALFLAGRKIDFHNKNLQEIPQGLVELVRSCLDFNPYQRPTASEALDELNYIKSGLLGLDVGPRRSSSP